MYDPKDYQEKKQACKGLRKAVTMLAAALIITLSLTILSVIEAQRETRIAAESISRCAAAELEIAYLNEVIDNLETINTTEE